jgi:hypothetical protein
MWYWRVKLHCGEYYDFYDFGGITGSWQRTAGGAVNPISATGADYWSKAVDLDNEGSIRIGFSSSPQVVPELGSVRFGVVNGDDLTFSLSGDMGGGGGWDHATGDGIGGFGGRWGIWPYPKTGTLTAWWSWTAEGIEPGSTTLTLPAAVANGSIWD